MFDQSSPNILKPQEPEYLVDNEYILASMGLLGGEYPDLAVRLMKKYIVRREQ